MGKPSISAKSWEVDPDPPSLLQLLMTYQALGRGTGQAGGRGRVGRAPATPCGRVAGRRGGDQTGTGTAATRHEPETQREKFIKNVI